MFCFVFNENDILFIYLIISDIEITQLNFSHLDKVYLIHISIPHTHEIP